MFKIKKDKSTFYFTYGTDPKQPHCGGWTEVVIERQLNTKASQGQPGAGLSAPYLSSEKMLDLAVKIFQSVHPNCSGREYMVNCAGIYSELPETLRTNGNFGKYCVERITLKLEEIE